MARTAAVFARGTRLSDHLSVIVRVYLRDAVHGAFLIRTLKILIRMPLRDHPAPCRVAGH